MMLGYPKVFVQCLCESQAEYLTASNHGRRVSSFTTRQSNSGIRDVSAENDKDEGPDVTFNPHDPRASFSLFPYDRLLFCDECQQIRCPRCWTEEIVNWYCPTCLFEVPSSIVKSDGNR